MERSSSAFGIDGLVGRGPELELLADFLDRARQEGEALILFGEAGSGKSALLEVAASLAASDGWRVLRVGGREFDADVTYAGLGQILMPLLDELRGLNASYRGAIRAALGLADGDSPNRLLVSNATLELLNRAAAVDPVLMIVDDVPWLDRGTAAVLGLVARRLAGSRIGFLAGSRVGEPGFFESAGLPEYELLSLDADSARSLLNRRFPELASRVRERVLKEANGNPLALLELPAALTPEQRAGRTQMPTVLPLGNRIRQLFDARIAGLPAPTRRLLLLMALHSGPDLRVLGSVQAGAGAGLDTLRPAEQAGLVDVDEQTRRLVFGHPLIRAAVVELARPQERRNAHRVLADAVADEPDRRAWHLADASSEPDEMVARLLQESAQRMLRRGDAVGAVTALARAADLSPDSAHRARRLVHAAYIAGDASGELLGATQLLDEAELSDVQVGSSLEAAVTAAWVMLTLDGNVETAHRLLVAAIELHGERSFAEDPAYEDALYTLLIVCYMGGQEELWRAFDEALERCGPDAPLALALGAKITADPVHQSLPVLNQLDDLLAEVATEANPTRILRLAMVASHGSRWAAIRAPLARVAREGREGGALALALVSMCLLAVDFWFIGRWDEAERLAEEALALCAEHGYGLQSWNVKQIPGCLAAARGDAALAREIAGEILHWAVPRRSRAIANHARRILCLLALTEGDFDGAFAQADAVSPAGTFAPYVPQAPWCMLYLVEAAVQSGRHADAAAHVRAMHDAHIGDISPQYAFQVAASGAISAPEDEASSLFDRALAMQGIDEWPFDVARLRLYYGEHLRRIGSRSDARAQLVAALDTFEQLGARPWVERAARELRAAGQSAQEGRSTGAVPLTAQEQEIAMLAATGLSNKQIGARLYMSHRTIGAHLYRIFPKLGITSRAQLRDSLARPPSSQPPPSDSQDGSGAGLGALGVGTP
jgi:DNA-binding CsgD family transcriptional regulator/energy-coupling factor transporter ATP-binding protein EcfA2